MDYRVRRKISTKFYWSVDEATKKHHYYYPYKPARDVIYI